MVRFTLTTDDAVKLKTAHDDLRKIIDLTEEFNRKYGGERKVSGFVVRAYECLHEVLYGYDE